MYRAEFEGLRAKTSRNWPKNLIFPFSLIQNFAYLSFHWLKPGGTEWARVDILCKCLNVQMHNIDILL